MGPTGVWEGAGFILSVDICLGLSGAASGRFGLSCTSVPHPLPAARASGPSDSGRLSYQNRGPGLYHDWLGRNIAGLGLENSSQRETIMRHFKKSELNATHSWQFLFMTSNNCFRCKEKGGRLSEFILRGCSMHKGWALDRKGWIGITGLGRASDSLVWLGELVGGPEWDSASLYAPRNTFCHPAGQKWWPAVVGRPRCWTNKPKAVGILHLGPTPVRVMGKGPPYEVFLQGAPWGSQFSLCSLKAWFLDQQHLCHRELVRKAESQISPQPYWITICIWRDDSQRHAEVQPPCSKDAVSIGGVTFWLSPPRWRFSTLAAPSNLPRSSSQWSQALGLDSGTWISAAAQDSSRAGGPAVTALPPEPRDMPGLVLTGHDLPRVSMDPKG